MAEFRPGDVVLLDYPFTTLTNSKRRPGLVLLDAANRDLLLARITSGAPRHGLDLRLADWRTAGRVLPSTVRLSKLMTLSETLIDRRFGGLTSPDFQAVAALLETMFKAEWPVAVS